MRNVEQVNFCFLVLRISQCITRLQHTDHAGLHVAIAGIKCGLLLISINSEHTTWLVHSSYT